MKGSAWASFHFEASFSSRRLISTSGFTGLTRKASMKFLLRSSSKVSEPEKTIFTVSGDFFSMIGSSSVPSMSESRRSTRAASKRCISI